MFSLVTSTSKAHIKIENLQKKKKKKRTVRFLCYNDKHSYHVLLDKAGKLSVTASHLRVLFV